VGCCESQQVCVENSESIGKTKDLGLKFLEFADKNRLVCLFMFERESIYLHQKLE
jgi:hypothetical protein